jgi:hypothetical protein
LVSSKTQLSHIVSSFFNGSLLAGRDGVDGASRDLTARINALVALLGVIRAK